MKKMYTPSQICKGLYNVKPIQITDLAQKGIVAPSYPAPGILPGQGNPRLYNKERVFDISLAMSMRGIFSINMTKRTIERIRDNLQAKRKWDIAVIRYSEKRGKSEMFKYAYGELTAEAYKVNLLEDPREYATVTINVTQLRDYINERF
jgi:hypothetical protein